MTDQNASTLQQCQERMGGFADKVEQLGSSFAEKAEHAWNATREETRQLASNVAQVAETGWEDARQFARRYPLTVFLGGFAVGFLVREALLSRGSSTSDMTRRMSRFSA